MIMRRLLLAAVAAVTAFDSAGAQLLPLSADINQRAWPVGVSIPTIANADLVYPGCPIPPSSFGNVWFFSPSGQTMTAYTSAGVSLNPAVTPHQGDATHPWKDPIALVGAKIGGTLSPTPGYSQMLLATAPRGVGGTPGPIQAGDEVVLGTGSYGAFFAGDSGASGKIINSPALTIAAGAGQTPLFTEMGFTQSTGFVLRGLKVQSINSDNQPLINIGSNQDGTANSNFALVSMDVSSASVATSNGWTQSGSPSWNASARQGIISNASSCVSVVGTNVYVVNGHNEGAIHNQSSNILVQNNTIDHFSTDGINFSGSNVAIIGNTVKDAVLTNLNPGDQYYVIRNSGVAATALQTNVYITRNKGIESTDAGQLFQAALQGFLNSNGDITNFFMTDWLCACSGNFVSGTGNVHDGLIANNSFMGSSAGGGQLQIEQAHGGSTGPLGNPPSNVRITNNIAPIIAYYGSNVQADHNIATNTVGNPMLYQKDWGLVQVAATPGSVTTASSDSGFSNTLDGLGPANEFTTVPTAASFPMSPQPNWTPLSGSPARTLGAAVLIPPLLDFNGASSSSIGALN